MAVQSGVLGEESNASGVSWGAILAGAFVAAAISLSMVALGTGLGLSSVSPWSNEGASATTLGIAAIVWLVLMQIISGSLGAYVAGRLRTKWVSVHTDEVFFRDTAHGFLVWAVGLVMTAAFLTSAVATLVGAGAKAGTAVVSATAAGAAAGAADAAKERDVTANNYFVDSLFRSDKTAAPGDEGSVRSEVGRIFLANRGRDFAPEDKAYLVQLVAARTGLAPPDAEKRVNDVLTKVQNAELQARQAADTARKAAAHSSLWIFISLLIGAFCASYAATIGGRQRDDYKL